MGVSAALRKVADAVGGFAGGWTGQGTYHDHDACDEYGQLDSCETSAPHGGRCLTLVGASRQQVELVVPQRFEDAQHIADRFREGASVFVDMAACEAELEKRLTDFCSGITCALEGSIERIDGRVLLLAPGNVELCGMGSSAAAGFFNQF